ncbi:MAG TPA: NHL repeat-containing protein [Mucilaginibacter sp.]|jgi:serine/threonine-protein kinase|nr:NHL repeat-containing protein [Mucilaginibacter sp.]
MKRYSILLLLITAFFVTSCSKKNDTVPNQPVIVDNTPTVTTIAGSGTQGFADGTKAQASFKFPTGITINSDGFLFIADKQNNRIRIISPQGVVNTIAGTGAIGFSNKKDSVSFNFPNSVSVDAAGNVYVADVGNSAIRAINALGVVTTFAKNGTGVSPGFNGPTGVVSDASGNVYVADNGNNLIRKISPKGVVTTFAGDGVRGSKNGTGAGAEFNQPQALAIDSSGNVYVADEGNNLIRKITSQGVVTTVAGSGSAGVKNGIGAAASFNGPAGIAVDASGNLYVGDSNNNLIRKIAPDGTATTLAGTGLPGSLDGMLASASFNNPQGVVVDKYKRVFVVDTGNGLIRMIQQ